MGIFGWIFSNWLVLTVGFIAGLNWPWHF